MACLDLDNCSKNSFLIPPCGSGETGTQIQLVSSIGAGTYRVRITKADGISHEEDFSDDALTLVLYFEGNALLAPTPAAAWPAGFFTENQGPYKVEVFNASTNAVVNQDDSAASTAPCVVFDIGQPWSTANPLIQWTFET